MRRASGLRTRTKHHSTARGVSGLPGSPDDRQRRGHEQEPGRAGFGERREHEAFEQRHAVIADQPLMHGKHLSFRKRQRLDRVIVRADDGDAGLGEHERGLDAKSGLAVEIGLVGGRAAFEPAGAQQHDVALGNRHARALAVRAATTPA